VRPAPDLSFLHRPAAAFLSAQAREARTSTPEAGVVPENFALRARHPPFHFHSRIPKRP